jgi:hypothetical protein
VAHGISRSSFLRWLRQANSDRVQLICRLTGIEARRVNAQLNEVSRIQSINDATLHQLERRLSEADDWLARA